MANSELMDMFSGYQVENVVTTSSDHMAISISLVGLDELPRLGPVHQKFCFEAAWLRAPDYMETVERA
jgi:hypothetical protein